ELGWKVWGIDLRNYNFQHNNFTFIKDDILTYFLPAESFDAITAVSTIEHIGVRGRYGIKERVVWADKSTLNMARRLLKPTGKFILTVPYGDIYKETPLNKVYDMSNLTWLCRLWTIKELRTTEVLALIELEK
ncbi:class I SAM-dependent methyltransferase, partial [Patescibacteria group bacterium]|nr:class I SAM-dependent methyltransferase [Patescibacteria group bacterium]